MVLTFEIFSSLRVIGHWRQEVPSHTGLTGNFPGLWFVKSKEGFSVAQFKSDTRSVSQSLCPDRDAGLYGCFRPNEQSLPKAGQPQAWPLREPAWPERQSKLCSLQYVLFLPVFDVVRVIWKRGRTASSKGWQFCVCVSFWTQVARVVLHCFGSNRGQPKWKERHLLKSTGTKWVD